MVEWAKLTSASAAELADRAQLEGAARELLAPDMRPEVYVERLRGERLWTEAVAVMSCALPLREAIAWGCLCDRSTMADEDGSRHEALLKAVERYVAEPTDEHRGAALELAQKEPDQSAGQMLAMAAGFSGGTIQVGDNPPVPVPVEAVPPMVAGAVMIAATRAEPADIQDTYARFLERAVDLARGGAGRLADEASGQAEG